MLAYHTKRTLLMMAVPKLPWSLDRFHTPFTVLTIASCGSTFNCLSRRRAPRSFNSLYILDELYALKLRAVRRSQKVVVHIKMNPVTYLYTPMTEVKSLGFPGTRLVKMNSNLVWLHLVKI